jgi:hypothetical protein
MWYVRVCEVCGVLGSIPYLVKIKLESMFSLSCCEVMGNIDFLWASLQDIDLLFSSSFKLCIVNVKKISEVY